MAGNSCAGSPEQGFALRAGDTVVFLGDSITAARGYTKIVELYTLMRHPERRVRFWNAGKGGDTASGAVARLERDVFGQAMVVLGSEHAFDMDQVRRAAAPCNARLSRANKCPLPLLAGLKTCRSRTV